MYCSTQIIFSITFRLACEHKNILLRNQNPKGWTLDSAAFTDGGLTPHSFSFSFTLNSDIFITHSMQPIAYDDIWHWDIKNANYRVNRVPRRSETNKKDERDKKREKWRMKMKENFPSWPGKLHRIGNRWTTTVTLSEKTLKVLLVWGEKLEKAAADRRDHRKSSLRCAMCGEKEWKSVF